MTAPLRIAAHQSDDVLDEGAAHALALGSDMGDDGGSGGFPFRLLAMSYSVGLVLSLGMASAGFGAITAVLGGWMGGVVVMTATPVAAPLLAQWLVRRRHARASLDAWSLDLEEERAEARAAVHAGVPRR
jgi:hypothetical protein